MPNIYYVALTNLNMYWTGMNGLSAEVRDARMYKSVKALKNNVESAFRRYNKDKGSDTVRITSYQIVEIEVKVRSTVEKIEI